MPDEENGGGLGVIPEDQNQTTTPPTTTPPTTTPPTTPPPTGN